MQMTPRQRIRAVLRGEQPDQVPFTIYWIMLPRGERERRLREGGLAIVERMPLFWEEYPNCHITQREYWENGVRTLRQTVRTPVGDVSCVRKVGLAYNSENWFEYYIKSPEDYGVVEYLVRDAVYHSDYDAYHIAQDRLGEDGYALPHIGYSPLMIMLIMFMGLERFSLDMVDHPDEFFSLYELLCNRRREVYRIYAESPAEVVLYGGNVVPSIMGAKRFEKYVLPCYNECADYLHERAKLLGVHLDADTKLFAQAVATSKIDVIEAFTPPPDCDMSVAEAREVWPSKTLWCNFPSSIHITDDHSIAATTRDLLSQAAPGERFLIGVTEDIPEAHMWRSLGVIGDVINQHGKLPLARATR
jgi:hypothetical protein